MGKPIVEARNYTQLGQALPNAFQAHPDKWIKLLFKTGAFQTVFGFVAMCVWVLTWLSGLKDLFKDHPDPVVRHDHDMYFGLSVAMCTVSAGVGILAAGLHLKATYSKGIGFVLVFLDSILIVWFATVYYHSTKLYQEQLDRFSRAIAGAEAASIVAGIFVLMAFFVELICAVLPAPPPPPPPNPEDPNNRKIDPDQIGQAVIDLQDAVNALHLNQPNMRVDVGGNNSPWNNFWRPGWGWARRPLFPLGWNNNPS